MKREIRDAWADALESGDYEQGELALCNGYPDGRRTFCCLGVLCELAVEAGVIPEPEPLRSQMKDKTIHNYGIDDPNTAYLPPEVAEWADLPTNPLIGDVFATYLNDGLQLSFTEIAKKVRTHL